MARKRIAGTGCYDHPIHQRENHVSELGGRHEKVADRYRRAGWNRRRRFSSRRRRRRDQENRQWQSRTSPASTTSRGITPFSRPKEFGDKLYLTPEEAQARAKWRAETNATQAAPSDPERSAPAEGGNVGAYNNFWFEWGSQNFMIDGKYRTSVLTDPPNGENAGDDR